jgi:hypothetical protein
MNLEGNKIEEWAGRGQRQVGRQSTWEWSIQQCPTEWKAWKMALEHLTPDGHIGEALGDWRNQHHQIMEWYLDPHTCTLYNHVEGVWTNHDATNIGGLRFQVDVHSCDAPNQYAHVVGACERARYMEIVGKQKISETQTPTPEHPIEYTAGIGDNCCTLPRHIQRLVGNIPDMDVPSGWDNDEEHGIIGATDGTVVFRVGYHSWVVATNNEHVLLSGSGDQLLVAS